MHNSSVSSTTQTQQVNSSWILQLNAPDPFLQGNIPQMANKMVKEIVGNDSFTKEQKTYAIEWESHFNNLFLKPPNPLLPAKAVCFLGIKVITPVLILYPQSRDQFIPLVRTQRNLLALLLPANTDVEKFVSNNADVYHLMLETIKKLDDITALNTETEQLLRQQAEEVREKIATNSTKSVETLQDMVKQWKSKIQGVNVKLTSLHAQAEELNHQFQTNAHDLKSIGMQLAAQQSAFQNQVNDLKTLLQKV